MTQLQDILQRTHSNRGEFVLGTVVDVRGSSYRKPGARVLIGADGRRVGLISGGCLEKDVVRHAFAWTDDGPQVVLYDTRGDRLHPAGDYGTGCDGMVWLLLERWPAPSGIDPLKTIERVWERFEPAVLATVYQGDGLGERWLLEADGPDPADAPQEIVGHMREAFDWTRPRSVRLKSAAGEISVLVEPIRPPTELVVFGAGDDVQPLVRIAAAMGWTVRVADRWPTLVTRQRFPEAAELRCEPTAKLAEGLLQIGAGSHVMLMTHNLEDDATLLPSLLASDAAWIGLLGPRRRTARLMRLLAERDALPSPADLERLQTPVGLDLGGDSPEEVALSIVSAIVALHNERAGGLLHRQDGPIHPEHETIVEEIE